MAELDRDMYYVNGQGLTFNAIDVETANADWSSICQIGVVRVRDGVLQGEWETLVDPEAHFDGFNTMIHGITEQDVKGSPTIADISLELRDLVDGEILVHHTPFDRVSISRSLRKYSLDPLEAIWLDSARVVRRAWPEKYARSGYGLANVAGDFGIEFGHHDALNDARMASIIFGKACQDHDVDTQYWVHRAVQPIDPQASKRTVREGTSGLPLSGETVVFTGALAMPRREAADIAANSGCAVADSVTKRTTMLVVGIQDEAKLNGYEKSSKQRKAESLVTKGSDIRILSEEDFHELVQVEERGG